VYWTLETFADSFEFIFHSRSKRRSNFPRCTFRYIYNPYSRRHFFLNLRCRTIWVFDMYSYLRLTTLVIGRQSSDWYNMRGNAPTKNSETIQYRNSQPYRKVDNDIYVHVTSSYYGFVGTWDAKHPVKIFYRSSAYLTYSRHSVSKFKIQNRWNPFLKDDRRKWLPVYFFSLSASFVD